MNHPLPTTQSFNEAEILELASLFKILSEPNRLQILEQIIGGYRCNCDLGKNLSLAPNLVSHHLSVLCDSGLVQSRRDDNDGRWIIYSINQKKLEKIKGILNIFFDEDRIQPCLSCCGTDQ